jgi:tetratricopeptide (TPR) repeat protein
MATVVLHFMVQLPKGDLFPAAFVRGLLCLTVFLWTNFSQAQRRPATPGRQATQLELKKIAEHGNRALDASDYATAEQDYKHLLRLGMRSASVYSNLGVVYLRTGRFDQAIHVLLKANSLAPSVAGIRLNLGLAYFRKHDFKTAASYFGNALDSNPDNLQARYLKGVCDFMLDDFTAAVKDFEPLQTDESNDLEYLFMLGTSYGMLKRTDDSLRTFQQMVEAGGDSPHLHLLLGKAYLALGQYNKAEPQLNRATKGDSLPFAHYYLGVLKRQTGHPDEAATEYQKEIDIDPTNIFAYKDLADIRLDQADADAAVPILEKGVAQNPHTPELLATLGRAYLQISRDDQAILVLRKAIALSPKVGSYHYQLGRAYLKAGRRAEASAEMARARSITSEAPEGKMRALSKDQEITRTH